MVLVKALVTRNPCYKNNLKAKSLYDSGQDERYWRFQCRGPQGGMLHSVGCAQPSGRVFVDYHWNLESQNDVCVHGVIDANDGIVYQCLPWNYRGWHGGGSSNNTHIGVEMCESKYIRYMLPGESGYSPGKFQILDKAKAQADCKRAYDSAVELFAMLAAEYKWDVGNDIVSHKEGAAKGIASNHGDPEHYWKGLGMPYTMSTFRAAVKTKMEENDMNKTEVQALIDSSTSGIKKQVDDLISAIANLNTSVQKLINAPKELQDNDAGEWSKAAREKAVEQGVIKGVGTLPNGDPNYAWESPVSRQQLITVLERMGLFDKG